MKSDTNRSLSGKKPAPTRSLSPIFAIKTTFRNTSTSSEPSSPPETDDADDGMMESFYKKMETMKLAPLAPALRNHVDLPSEEEGHNMHAGRSGSTDEVLSPLDLDAERRFALPARSYFPDRGDTPRIVTEHHQQNNTLVEEPESYTEPSLLLEGVSTGDIKPSAMHLISRGQKERTGERQDSDHDMDVDTTPGS